MRTQPDHHSRALELALPIALILLALVVAVVLARSDSGRTPQTFDWLPWAIH